MYRAVALAALRHEYGKQHGEQIAALAARISLVFLNDRVILDGYDVTAQIRTTEVSNAVYLAADNYIVREQMVKKQREFADDQDTVTEGRDQSTVAFPHAECKIFLTATPAERARRRHAELLNRGEATTFEKVLAEQNERDHRDATRAVGAMKIADDAIQVYTDGMSYDEVVDRLEQIVRARQRELGL